MTDTTTAGRERVPATLLGRIGAQNISLLIALVVLLAIFGALRPDVFFTPRNLINIGLAVTLLGILAMAQTVVIVSGGLDISVGSIVGLSTMVLAVAAQETGSIPIGILAG
ncbi:ABC transporter permease, partial [Mesorhizobium sp. M4B.F.Ca.ET.089.01.1.1]